MIDSSYLVDRHLEQNSTLKLNTKEEFRFVEIAQSIPTKLAFQEKGGKNREKTKNASAIFPTLVHVQPNGQMMTIRNLRCYKTTTLKYLN